jgi:methylmalonyl-CoA/ethylmalonyl-CoA epimerase
MITRINHVGMVVKNIDETLKMLSALFGAKEIGRKAFPELGQTSCLVAIGDSKYELMEPIGSEGVVPKFLEKNGEGFHHVSLLSDDLAADCTNFEKNGARILTRGDKMAFLHPKTTGGILYEIAEE